jgi:acetyltransferase-like isoleucine patch superfamily enzyme
MKKISHGNGSFSPEDFSRIGEGVIFEEGVMVFHPENIIMGSHIYVGHQTILKGYHCNKMTIGDGVWIGQQCFLHSAGGIAIEGHVGIGPGVKIITSSHRLDWSIEEPILYSEIMFAAVVIEEGSDIGAGSILLPGVKIGRGAQVGAGSVVTRDVEAYTIVAGNPARIIRRRK